MAITAYSPATSQVLMGLSTDTKPTNVALGTRFLETNTGKVFLFLNDGSTWLQVALIPTSGWTETGLSVGI
jgi:hypothetical protein